MDASLVGEGALIMPEEKKLMDTHQWPVAPERAAESCERDLHMIEINGYAPVRSSGTERQRVQYTAPLNLAIAVKEKNGGKLSACVWGVRSP